MIKINLLPVKAVQKQIQMRNNLIVAVSMLLLLGGVCYVFHSMVTSDIAAVEQEINDNRREISSLKKKIGEVNRFKKLQEELRNKLKIMNELRASKSVPVHLMDELIRALPEKLWLTSFTEKNGSVQISGVGLTENDVAVFMTNLERSPYYSKVDLKVTKQKVQDGLRLQNFDISCRAENPGVADDDK
ncbi:MAG: PilN domain-containing protein [Desulfuromonadaceae bacterium]|nr:PilN domain-containing protein [Desulfuromonadaceae bacterium]